MQSSRLLPAAVIVATSLAAACSAPMPSDAGADGSDARRDGLAECRTDLDCDDMVFCNGVEHCAPNAAGADDRGCVSASPATPCLPDQACIEATRRCDANCRTNPDMDGDGHLAAACGGDDCDDSDPNRFPGNTEVCAWDNATGTRTDPTHDEDCDANTISNAATRDGDRDHDTYIDSACCNARVDGTSNCGDDCADTTPVQGVPADFMTVVAPASIHPTQVELCNGIDDNCTGGIDEGLPSTTYYPDCDGDGAGSAESSPTMACAPSGSPRCDGHEAAQSNDDCNDTDPSVHHGATEVCNGRDDNCDGTIDENLPGVPYYADCDGDGFGDSNDTGTMACAPGIAPACMAHPSVSTRTDCDDVRAEVHPGTSEVCNGRDEDCNGRIDTGCPATIDVSGTRTTTSLLGSTAGTNTMARCAAGYVVNGFIFHQTSARIDGIALYCQRPVPSPSGDPYQYVVDSTPPQLQVSPTAGTAVATYTRISCPAGYVGRGFVVNQGSGLFASPAIECINHPINGHVGAWTVGDGNVMLMPFSIGNSTVCPVGNLMVGANFYWDSTSVHGIEAVCVPPQVTLLP